VSHGYTPEGPAAPVVSTGPPEHELVTTLFDLGRQVTAVLDFNELLQRIPQLIGRLIAFEALAVYLLDEQLQPVPAGAEGELHIGGDGLASGYLNRPDLTAEKFVPNPFCRDASARLYKTGDLARFEEDGNIECLGRLDHQTKIRGFRIEVGEIETAIQSHNAVAHAVVVAKKYETDDQRLLAYLVLNRDAEELTIRELRTFLGQRLPDYMIPSSFLVLEKIPLTPSGKVDRNLLLQHPGAKRVRGEQFICPRDPLEHAHEAGRPRRTARADAGRSRREERASPARHARSSIRRRAPRR
jgi:acyl-CoA synthetase (AMP-forming)/AMP-acid ligase II